ncbi:hypothetical protein CCR94_16260 [Rhodoblastus sphagnicola]|uniref:Uncharacterized protein n=1 Tax=Rhodoblastus sphagnicola TaxID=333368 RepID=A0A2S6N2U5_9HYPH|nr:hypothetical protein [Rhodoblastus sphagnicola]MBB4199047.1 hypothetical protein [Rhodoblastus sphagnicola]PPQ28943.1 hypothetical protein CCR94_16260 [Rhodoblastus sphagnicola]
MTNIAQLAGVALSPSLTIETNADFRGALTVLAGVDLTGIVFRMQVRDAVGSTNILADLSSSNGALSGDASGVLHYVLTAAQTKFLAPYAGTTAVADILAEGDGETLNLCAAPLAIAISAGVTTP